jgi:hypothetical protein
MRVKNVRLGCLPWLLLFSVLLAWDSFTSGDFFWGITGSLGILVFGLAIVGAFSGPVPPQREPAPYRRT